jgi:hypothetical protein
VKFEEACGALLRDPWEARDAYVELLTDRAASRVEFLRARAPRTLGREERARALTLLEAARASMTMYTSCGWFFDDISGVETVQTLRYAGRVVELMDDLGLAPPSERFLEVLSEARSNMPERGTGADIFLRAVELSRVTPRRVAAHLAISNLVGREARAAEFESAGYDYRTSDAQRRRHGRVTLETMRLSLEERATARTHDYALAAMHFGEVDYYCALRPYEGREKFEEAAARLWSQFRTASLPAMLRVAQGEFGPDEFGLEALLPQGQGRLSRAVFGRMVARLLDEYERVYEDNRRVVERLVEIGFEPPRELRVAAELTTGRRLETELRAQRLGEGDYARAFELAREAARLGQRIDRTHATRVFEKTLVEAARRVVEHPSADAVRSARELIALGRELGLEANLERAQEIIYEAARAWVEPSEELREFALALGLAPSALAEDADADVTEAQSV